MGFESVSASEDVIGDLKNKTKSVQRLTALLTKTKLIIRWRT